MKSGKAGNITVVIQGTDELEAKQMVEVIRATSLRFGLKAVGEVLDSVEYGNDEVRFNLDVPKLTDEGRRLISGMFNFAGGVLAQSFAAESGYIPSISAAGSTRMLTLAPDSVIDARLILKGADKYESLEEVESKASEIAFKLGIPDVKLSYGNDEVYLDFKARSSELPALERKLAREMSVKDVSLTDGVSSGKENNTKTYTRDKAGRAQPVQTLIAKL